MRNSVRFHSAHAMLSRSRFLAFALTILGCTVGLAQTPKPVLDGTAIRGEHYEPSQMLRLVFALNPPHPVEEAKFLEDLQDRSSPVFHQFLTAEQWNARFAPSPEDEQAVVDWAKAQGLTITFRYNSRLAVDAEAPAGVLEKAFNVTLDHYRTTRPDGTVELNFSNDRDPVLPPALVPIVASVHGLDSFEYMSPANSGGRPRIKGPDYTPGPVVEVREQAQADAASSDETFSPLTAVDALQSPTPAIGKPPTNKYQPSDIWTAGSYDYLALMNQGHCCNPLGNPGASSYLTSIAVAAFGDATFSDIGTFHSAFPYLAYNVQKINVNGGYGACAPNTPAGPDANCFETTLDVEYTTAMANGRGLASNTAEVFLYEAPNTGVDTITVYNQIHNDGHARVMSTSFGCPENSNCFGSTITAMHNTLGAMAGQGWTIVAATGDGGATANCNDALAVQYPSTDLNVVAAGGTSLQEYSSEVAWTGSNAAKSCSKNNGGGTGGFSTIQATPGYQSGMGLTSRAVPDLALNAAIGELIVFQGAYSGVGGTSVAAPEIAGFFAQENSYLLAIGNACGSNGRSACAPMGNPLPAIYAEARNHYAGHYPFYDITSGCNTNDITVEYKLTAFCAHAGFDEVTGWGSANMLQLAWAINWQYTAASGRPYMAWTGPTTNKWYNHNETVSWTIEDFTASTTDRGTGIAGFTQGWDSIPADATSEPSISLNPASTNTFYTGPQFPNGNAGCLALSGTAGCGAGVSQGCHTVHVRGWNNQGWTTGDATYGPICYDLVDPTVSDSFNAPTGSNGWYIKAAIGFLNDADSGGSASSGISRGYYGLNTPECTPSNLACNTFTNGQLISIDTEGVNTLNYFAEDNAGNFSKVSTTTIKLDRTAPVTTAGFSGVFVQNAWEGTVTVNLKANDALSGVAVTYYSWNGGANVKYTGPFTVATVGNDTLRYYSVDVAGNTEKVNVANLVIAPAPTSTVLTATPGPTAIGQSVTLTAAITSRAAGAIAGTVAFKDGPTTIGTAGISLSGSAALTLSTLGVGAHSITAVYSGDAGFLTSTSGTLSETIHPSATTTTMTAVQSPTSTGANVTFTIKVVAVSGPVPTGSVNVTEGGQPAGQVSLNSSGIYTYTDAVPSGTYPFVATYVGTTTDQVSTSKTLTLVVP